MQPPPAALPKAGSCSRCLQKLPVLILQLGLEMRGACQRGSPLSQTFPAYSLLTPHTRALPWPVGPPTAAAATSSQRICKAGSPRPVSAPDSSPSTLSPFFQGAQSFLQVTHNGSVTEKQKEVRWNRKERRPKAGKNF